MSSIRRRIWFGGRVQGVGFRMTVHHIASSYQVMGYVKNLVDGQVEMVAEGEPVVLDSFLAAIREWFGPMIRSETETPVDSSDETLVGFMIRV